MEAGLTVQQDRVNVSEHSDASISANNISISPEEILEIALKTLDDDKAENIVTIDLVGKSDVADAMIVATGRSQRHVGELADHIARNLKDAGHRAVSMEGQPACDWVLLDAKDVVIHIFRPEVRDFYNLERIWAPDPDTAKKH